MWDVTKGVEICAHQNGVGWSSPSRHSHIDVSSDESHILVWGGSSAATLFGMTKPEEVQRLKHDGPVDGAQFSRDESRVLTWSGDKTARLWDCSDPLSALVPHERILELEVRSGTTLNDNLTLRVLKVDEWNAKARSPKYRKLQQTLAQSRAKASRTQPPAE